MCNFVYQDIGWRMEWAKLSAGKWEYPFEAGILFGWLEQLSAGREA